MVENRTTTERLPGLTLLYEAIKRRESDRSEAILTHASSTCWAELSQSIDRFCQDQERLARRRIGLALRGSSTGLAALAALEHLECDAFLIPGDLPLAEARLLAEELRLGALVIPGEGSGQESVAIEELTGEDPGSGGASVTILTSGTTGKPKAVRHTWASLARPARVASEALGQCWLLTYRPHFYAGLQVILQCVLNSGTLVIPRPSCDAQEVAELAARAGVQYASATPSYWRWLITFADPATLTRVPLVQLTLGGETVSQQILDALRRKFPGARLVHIYATTELGRCFSVTDGLAGFPSRFLERPSPENVEMRIAAGELQIRSANAMERYDRDAATSILKEGWFCTGDLVGRVGDRVHFLGRRSDLINVGGNKVHPLEVEQVIREVPGVADVRVFAMASSVAGQIVACEIVPHAGIESSRVHDSVNRQCLGRLASHQRPRLIRLVDRISLTDAGKAPRRPAR